MVGPEELHGTKRNSHDQNGGRDLKSFFPSDYCFHQPERHNNAGDGQNAPDHGVEIAFRQAADQRQRMNRRADSAPGYRRSIRNQIQDGSVEGRKSQAHHEGAGNSDGRAEARAAFQECAKAEGHQQGLQPPV